MALRYLKAPDRRSRLERCDWIEPRVVPSPRKPVERRASVDTLCGEKVRMPRPSPQPSPRIAGRGGSGVLPGLERGLKKAGLLGAVLATCLFEAFGMTEGNLRAFSVNDLRSSYDL